MPCPNVACFLKYSKQLLPIEQHSRPVSFHHIVNGMQQLYRFTKKKKVTQEFKHCDSKDILNEGVTF